MEHDAVIIVRKKKGGHGGHHGGAWKVAYADFVTAMMALFLVMWLVGQSQPVKQSVASYFRDPGAFETTRGSDGILDGGKQAVPSETSQPAADQQELETIARHIKEALDKLPELKSIREQIELTLTKEGLRIELLDSNGASFFENGSAGMPPATARVLSIVANELGTLNAPIVVEGHTDSRKYTTSESYSNWELSSDRANAARRVLETNGLQTGQIISVRGHADRHLRIPADALDPRNRRVSVIVRARPE